MTEARPVAPADSVARPIKPREPLGKRLRDAFLWYLWNPFWRRVELPFLRLATRHPRLGMLYYLFEGSLDREVRGVIYGRLQAVLAGEAHSLDARRLALRRGIHRLEKGLIMRPVREVFALDYISEVVGNYERLTRECWQSGKGDPLQEWATDVLDQYFTHARGHEVIERERVRYRAIRELQQIASNGRSPFVRSTAPLRMTIEDLEELVARRRSVRWYRQEPVPRALIDRAMQVAVTSPSACNRQPFEFRIFDDPALLSHVAKVPGGVRGFAENFPCFVAIVGRLRAFPKEYDRHVIFVDGALAAMSFIYALELLGVGTCCINWADRKGAEEEMARLLGLEPDERVVMCMSLGFPDPEAKVPYSQKKTLDEIRSYNNAPGITGGGPA